MAPRPIDVNINGHDNTKPAFDSAHKNAEDFGTRLKETLNKPFDLLKGLLAVEMVRLFSEFAKSSVEEAAQMEAAWNRVAQSVENAGISFGGVRGELAETFDAISGKTRFSEKEISSAFSTVLTVTNDYAGSVKNLGLITNIAVAKQLDLDTAATIVGKAMDGQTAMLKRYGIVIKDGADAMDELNKRFSGFAERDGKSLEGRLHQVANEWEEVKIKMGQIIAGSDTAMSTFGSLADTLKRLAEWLEASRVGFQQWSLEFKLGLASIKGAINDAPVVKGERSLWERIRLPQSEIDAQFAEATAVNTDETPEHGDAAYHNALAKERARAKGQTEEQIAANARQVAADKAERDATAADKALTKRIEDLKKEADVLLQSRDLTTLTAADEKRIGDYAVDLYNTSRDTNKSLKERTAAAEQLHRIAEADKKISDESLKNAKEIAELNIKGVSLGALRAKLADALLADRTDLARDPNGGLVTRRPGAPNPISFLTPPTAAALPVGVGSTSFGREVGFNIKSLFGGDAAFKGVDTSLGSLSDHLESLTAGGVKGLFDAWQQGIADVIQGHEKMGTVILRVARQAVGGALAADAQDTMLRAAKALALGLTDPTGIHLGQAAKLFAVGTAELAAAAALSGGGGGGGYGGGVSAGGFQQTQSQIGSQGKTTVVFKGKRVVFDLTNPDDLNALRDALQSLSGTRDLEFLFEDN